MSKRINVSLVILLVLTFLPAAPVQAQSNADCDYFGTHSDGALYCITMPANWNGDLVIFAHGYVTVDEPVDIPWSQMRFVNENGYPLYMPDVINGLGFAFATTSYSENGLAVKQGIDDIVDLIGVFKQKVRVPVHVYVVGASEGGLVTTLVIERYSNLFSGGLAACGPIGSFTSQVNYWGDFRVIFDYFMDTPNLDVLPGNAVNIPSSLMSKWETVYTPRISEVLVVNPLNTQRLFSVTKAPFDLSDLSSIGQTTLGILWYNVFATNDAVDKLGGHPYDNFDRVYTGLINDPLLNEEVKRFKAQPAALEEIANYYETTGNLLRPMVTMHTTGDPIVPVWHQELYTEKVSGVFPAQPYVPITIDRYGHCSFTLAEIQAGFSQLVGMVMYDGMTIVTPMRILEAGESSQLEGTYSYDYR